MVSVLICNLYLTFEHVWVKPHEVMHFGGHNHVVTCACHVSYCYVLIGMEPEGAPLEWLALMTMRSRECLSSGVVPDVLKKQ